MVGDGERGNRDVFGFEICGDDGQLFGTEVSGEDESLVAGGVDRENAEKESDQKKCAPNGGGCFWRRHGRVIAETWDECERNFMGGRFL